MLRSGRGVCAVAQMVFKRVEKKYLLKESQKNTLMSVLHEHMLEDDYGETRICSLYYDTENCSLIRSSVWNNGFKEKLRLRSYGVPKGDSTVYVEIKRKVKHTVCKRRECMTLNEARKYLAGGEKPFDSQIMRELDYFRSFYKPFARVFLGCTRTALLDKNDSDLRITFDEDLVFRTHDLDLECGAYGKPLLLSDERLMEIKTTSAFPLWLTKALCELGINQTSFSKYGKCYLENIEEFSANGGTTGA